MTDSNQMLRPRPPRHDAGHRDLHRAWLALLLLPVAFAAAVALGDWLVSIQGYGGADTSIPSRVALRAAIPACLVLIAPAVVTFAFGLRARAEGVPAGGKAALVGFAAALGLVLLNLVPLFVLR
ncbi:hypothetical protein HFP15_32790 [Amycolatopsis sp. K13G38]|uniref:Uncharacterized protein n=1 Tax=Amycolatopsis acididurans TaxID=2724524 RepID=A0ABX1JFW6_9PSEU|nr:hypothetical protein [Amycolatopsis acididurans]NKQ57650.1 hypothetical protein [Amycolatopsis acididurans]